MTTSSNAGSVFVILGEAGVTLPAILSVLGVVLGPELEVDFGEPGLRARGVVVVRLGVAGAASSGCAVEGVLLSPSSDDALSGGAVATGTTGMSSSVLRLGRSFLPKDLRGELGLDRDATRRRGDSLMVRKPSAFACGH
eukprot:CAMPEP_0194503902 /NCGR_PEP_ID=MMETSP0253-20130528/28637_1 /TAXON_ID=2966 /ORGANISM="Noctiluca scintillans" /LENGTH=138 /DNA_ID=CAMNT_0039346235 /DNA_START=1997 /DNA_END=2410 /DNA_ORIENTATION=+